MSDALTPLPPAQVPPGNSRPPSPPPHDACLRPEDWARVWRIVDALPLDMLRQEAATAAIHAAVNGLQAGQREMRQAFEAAISVILDRLNALTSVTVGGTTHVTDSQSARIIRVESTTDALRGDVTDLDNRKASVADLIVVKARLAELEAGKLTRNQRWMAIGLMAGSAVMGGLVAQGFPALLRALGH